MNTAAKHLLAMRRNPLDWQLAELQTVARQRGIDGRHDGSSHGVFIRADGKTLSVPAHRPVQPLAPRIQPCRPPTRETTMREVLSILADIATIVTAICATGILVRVNIHLSNNSSKNADQRASGTSNRQNIKQ